MLVPGAVLKKIVSKLINFDFLNIPKLIEVNEDETQTVKISVKNYGNQEGKFNLLVEIDDDLVNEFQHSLKPNQIEDISFHFTPTVHKNRKSSKISCRLRYKDQSGIDKSLPTRVIQIKIQERKDKVEIDTSALDKLDNI